MFGLRPSAPGFSFSNLGKNLFLKSGKNWGDKGALSLGKILGLSAALPFIPGINDAKQDTLPGSERGWRLLDSQGNEALPADLRAEVREAYESGDADKIAAINDYYNFLPGLNAVRLPDITPYLPYPNYATGGRVGRAFGGIMDTYTGRRKYGFGSFFKKITKPFKKALKSPIGKLALMGGLGYLATPGTGASIFSPKGKGGWWKKLWVFVLGLDLFGQVELPKCRGFHGWNKHYLYVYFFLQQALRSHVHPKVLEL